MKYRAQLAAAAVIVSFGGLVLWRSERTVAAKVLPPSPLPEPVAQQPPAVLEPAPTTPEPPLAPRAEPKASPKVDLVFAVDTTGSMGGLLAGAKMKIWEIARRAQEGKPTPKVRVGLVAYRDRGDDYVTRVLDLTSDMDKAYATLSEFAAAGGGDGPEHVIKGLHDAVDKMSWSGDRKAVKVIYLVGDAPPHYDYQDGLTLKGVLSDATQRGLVVNAIRCGGDPATLTAWTQIANATNGDVSSIESSGGVAIVATPFDAELAHLNTELAGTEIHFGTTSERKDADEVVRQNLLAPAAAQADRAAFYGKAAESKAGPTKNDLAAAPSASAVASIATSNLPDELQRMNPEERLHFVQQKQEQRGKVLARMREVTSKRDAWLKGSTPAPSPTSFDSSVYSSLKKAGASKGVAF